MRRLLDKHFMTYLVDEHYTSITCNTCKSKNEYFKKVVDQPTFTLKKTYVHGLLCCSNNKKCSKLWNRDTNGAKNILEILKSHINGMNRPAIYCDPKSGSVISSSKESDKTEHAYLRLLSKKISKNVLKKKSPKISKKIIKKLSQSKIQVL